MEALGLEITHEDIPKNWLSEYSADEWGETEEDEWELGEGFNMRKRKGIRRRSRCPGRR